MMNNLVEFVRDNLDVRNVGPQIIDKVPTLIKRAILNLEKDDILPPRVLEFVALDKKEEKRDTNDELLYHYFKLPEDFIRLDEFFVKDDIENGGDNTKRIPYFWAPYENYIDVLKTNESRKYFTITDVHWDDEKTHKILIANPFPKDNTFVRIKYYTDGNKDSFDNYDERTWDVILTEIESNLGLRNPQDADEKRTEQIASWKHQEGKNVVNNTIRRTKVYSTLFGKDKSSLRIRRGSNRRR